MKLSLRKSQLLQALILVAGLYGAQSFATVSATFVNVTDERALFTILDMQTTPPEVKFAGYLSPNESTPLMQFFGGTTDFDGIAAWFHAGGNNQVNVNFQGENNTIRMD